MNKTQIWTQASKIFADISELSPKKALAHLYGIQNITADVRNAVITLINAGSQASQYFADEISPGYNVGFNNNQNYHSGQILNEYKLLEELGHGGMSQVFKAKRINADQQTLVAIKIFSPRNNSEALLKHFIIEQEILSKFSHPHIVKMLHGGMTEDKIAYIVMELIEDAQPLDKYCQAQKLSIKMRIKLIAKCADALAYSHANLIIHRDIKPDNILIDANKHLKIVDFGIAKLINNDISGSKTTIMALTPSYAAPEQINSEQITVKTDIFSLAVVALDLLTKEDPLPKDRLIKSCSNDEVYLDRLFKLPIGDKDLKNILRKALEQEPNKRYSSMQSFADDLNNYLMNKPVNATSQSLTYRVQKFAKRRSALFATMVSFMIFLIVGSFFGYQQYKQIKVEAEKANQVKQFMLDAYAQTNPDYAKGNVITAEDILNSTAKKLEDSQLDQEIKFELLQTIGIAYGQLGQAQKAADFLQKSLDIKQNDSKSLSYRMQFLHDAENWEVLSTLIKTIDVQKIESSLDKARIYRIIAKTQARNSKFSSAMENLNKAIVLNISNQDKSEELQSKKLLAEFYYLQSKPQEGIKLLESILQDKDLDKTDSLIMGLRSDLYSLYTDIGDYKKAKTGWIELINQQRLILGDLHPELAYSLIQLTGVYRYLGDLENAQKSIQEAHDINLKIFGENNIQSASSLNSLAVMSYQTGNIPKAIEQMYQVIKIFEEKQSPDYSDTLKIKTNLAALLNLSNRLDEALTLSREVYDIQLKKLGINHGSTIYSQQILAKVLLKLNQHEEAQQLAELSYENSIKHLGNKNPLTIGAYFTLATIYDEQDEYNKALKIYNQIIELNLITENDPRYPKLMITLAEINVKISKYEQAQFYFQKGINLYEDIYGKDHKKTIQAGKKYAEFLAQQK